MKAVWKSLDILISVNSTKNYVIGRVIGYSVQFMTFLSAFSWIPQIFNSMSHFSNLENVTEDENGRR